MQDTSPKDPGRSWPQIKDLPWEIATPRIQSWLEIVAGQTPLAYELAGIALQAMGWEKQAHLYYLDIVSAAGGTVVTDKAPRCVRLFKELTASLEATLGYWRDVTRLLCLLPYEQGESAVALLAYHSDLQGESERQIRRLQTIARALLLAIITWCRAQCVPPMTVFPQGLHPGLSFLEEGEVTGVEWVAGGTVLGGKK